MQICVLQRRCEDTVQENTILNFQNVFSWEKTHNLTARPPFSIGKAKNADFLGKVQIWRKPVRKCRPPKSAELQAMVLCARLSVQGSHHRFPPEECVLREGVRAARRLINLALQSLFKNQCFGLWKVQIASNKCRFVCKKCRSTNCAEISADSKRYSIELLRPKFSWENSKPNHPNARAENACKSLKNHSDPSYHLENSHF